VESIGTENRPDAEENLRFNNV